MPTTETLRCCECKRAIVNRLFDKCLYCGAELDAELTLSEEEKAELRKIEMQKLDADKKARYKREVKRDSTQIGWGSADDFWFEIGFLALFCFFD